MKGVNIRAIALKLLLGYETEGKYVNLLLSSPIVREVPPEQHGFLTTLLYTTVENKLKYDYFIATAAKRPISELDSDIRNILRLGMCQIFDMSSVPPHAIVNETVKLAPKYKSGFVNAVLRAALGFRDNPPYPDREKNLLRYLSIRYSFPLDLVKFFAAHLGISECEPLLVAFTERRGLSISVNTVRTSREELLLELSSYGASAARYTDKGIILKNSINPEHLPGFNEGKFFVQDEASRIAVEALGLKAGERVIDVCAAPGGKSFLAAADIVNGELYSYELHKSKLSLIDSGRKRLGLDNIHVAAHDATSADEMQLGSFDAVICDVPCSGLGVLSKKADLRYRDLKAIDELPPLQYSILEQSAKYLKAGGRMIYSTCTLNPMENREVTDAFIRANPEFSYCEFEVGGISSDSGCLTLLPHVHGTDGFFVALLRRNK